MRLCSFSEGGFAVARGKGLPTAYHDPVLKSSPVKYTGGFLRELRSCNISGCIDQPARAVGCFIDVVLLVVSRQVTQSVKIRPILEL